MDQLPENMRVLRLFGADKQVLARLLAGAKNNTGIKIESMEQGGETLLLLEAVASSSVAITAALDAWQAQVAEKCEGALYGMGDTSLTQATFALLAQKKLLFACVDAQTSALVEGKLGVLPEIDAIYDFGEHSHAHPKYTRKIALGSKFAQKYPTQTAQQVAGQVKVCYQYSGADYVLSILPQEDGSHLIILGEKAGYWLRRTPAGENALLWAVDMMRRAAIKAVQAKGTIRLAYGAAMPDFAVVESIADKGEDFIAPAQEAFDAPPPPDLATHATGKVLGAIALMLLVAVIGIALLYAYTGGDIASLWNDSGLSRFQVSSATLL